MIQMKKFVIAFIVGSLSKGLLMFLLILSNDYTSNHIFAEWLIWFLVFGFVIAATSTAIWLKRNKKIIAKNVQ